MLSRAVCCRTTMMALALAGGLAAFANEAPIPVSPGSGALVVRVERRCPTYSWSGVEGASAYEIVLYRLQESEAEAALRGARWAVFPEDEILRHTVPGGALSWSATMAEAVEPGAVHAWFIRADVAGRLTDWSDPRLFTVPLEPSPEQVREALDVLTRHLEAREPRAEQRRPAAEDVASRLSKIPADDTSRGRVMIAVPPSPVKTGVKAEQSDVYGATIGVHGISHSSISGSTGVVGQTTAAIGATYGVRGEVASAGGIGGMFKNTAGGQILSGLGQGGFEMFSAGGDGMDVYGAVGHHSNGNFGVLGDEDYGVKGQHSGGNWGSLGGSSVGVYGSSADAWAGFFWGDVWVGTGAPDKGLQVEGLLTLDHRLQADDADGLEFATDDGVARVEIHNDGGIKIGSNGTPFLEIRMISGTTLWQGHPTYISYPAGYNKENTCVLGVEVQSASGSWSTLADIWGFWLREDYIYMYDSWMEYSPYRIWVLKATTFSPP